MTEFKVGDRVRSRCFPDWGVMKVVSYDTQPIYKGVEISADADDGRRGAFPVEDIYIADQVTPDELTSLRAFRDRAIARYPDLATETDYEAIDRFCSLLDTYDRWSIVEEIIAWARANPRE